MQRLSLSLLTLVLVVGSLAIARAQSEPDVGGRSYLPLLLAPQPSPTATTGPTTTATTAPPSATQPPAAPAPTATSRPATCAPEYPTVCIPPPPPDLDCGDIPYRRFTVLPPDRHRFDADKNGIGCESG